MTPLTDAQITPAQRRKFKKICKDMRNFLCSIQKSFPAATLYIEDGAANLYDWPSQMESRPNTKLIDGEYWPGATGGGK